MNLRQYVVASVFAAITLGALGEEEESKDVVVLTNSNFDKIIDGSKHVLVKFYAPWCGHCKSLAPTWAKLATTFKDEANVLIAKLDATVETEAAKKFEIKGYPTLLFFPKGQPSNHKTYSGDRSLEGLVTWFNKETFSFRKPGGGILETGGRLSQLDDVISATVKECSSDGTKCVGKLIEAVKGVKEDPALTDLHKKAYAYYSTALGKVASSADWLLKEKARLSKMAEKPTMADEQKLFLYARLNILTFFEKELESLSGGKKQDEL